MLELNVGNKWTEGYLQKITALNAASKNTKNRVMITSLYGDPLGMPYRGVRPSDRLPECNITPHKYIEKAAEAGIDINLTMNKPCTDAYTSEATIRSLMEYVREYAKHPNVIFTVSSPYIMEHMAAEGIRMELSTIANQTSINFIVGMIERYRDIEKICLPIYMNRDFKKIHALVDTFTSIKFELIVNEFCVSAQNTCIYRMDCYNTQSHGVHANYYFERCAKYRSENPIAWMLAPIVFPEWMNVYERTVNMRHFKLTGRTLPENAIIENVIRWITEKTGDCDIRQLWGAPLPGQNFNGQMIPASKISDSVLLMKFINFGYPCEEKICGGNCKRCHEIFTEIMSDVNNSSKGSFFSELNTHANDAEKYSKGVDHANDE